MNRSLAQGQRGLSLVELMVGVAVGLFVVAAATLMVTTQLTENRRLLAETQLQQDLRTSADIIARELRRSGSWPGAETAVSNPAEPGASAPAPNPFLDVAVVTGTTGQILFTYKRPDNADSFGFRLSAPGVIETKLYGAGWQELTDRSVLLVNEFEVTLANSASKRLPCAKACPGPIPVGSTDEYCYPELKVRDVIVRLKGTSIADPAVVREVQSRVRLRNDELRFHVNAGADACPS